MDVDCARGRGGGELPQQREPRVQVVGGHRCLRGQVFLPLCVAARRPANRIRAGAGGAPRKKGVRVRGNVWRVGRTTKPANGRRAMKRVLLFVVAVVIVAAGKVLLRSMVR